MNFELNDDQQSIVEAVESLLVQHAGAARAIELAAKQEVDARLGEALAESGFLELALGEDTGALEATLLVEAVARAGGVASTGAAALVAPLVAGRLLPGPVALVEAQPPGPVRFAAHARSLLVLDEEEVRFVETAPGDAEPVRSNFGFPMGRLRPEALARGESLGPGTARRMRSAWRLALAAEAVGAMGAALGVTLDYVQRRRQFGRAIGSFQAVQHRLGECAVWLHGARWLTLEAAAHGAPAAETTVAAAQALAAAQRVFAETHQLSGAMGFTHEHDLHVWTMRLPALWLELGGVAAHRRAVAQERWT